MQIPESDRFSPAEVAALIAAAERHGPIPDGEVKLHWEENDTAPSLTRRVALIRIFENAEIAIQIGAGEKLRPPSRAIMASLQAVHKTASRLEKHLSKVSMGSPDTTGLAVYQILTRQADTYAERQGGFEYHPRMIFTIGEHQISDWFADAQLKDDIEAVKRLRVITEEALATEKRRAAAESTIIWTPTNKFGKALMFGDQIKAALTMVAAAWSVALERKVTDAINPASGIATGPFYDFAVETMKVLGLPLGTDAIRSHARRMGLFKR